MIFITPSTNYFPYSCSPWLMSTVCLQSANLCLREVIVGVCPPLLNGPQTRAHDCNNDHLLAEIVKLH